MLRMLADFGSQSATKAAKSSSFSTMSGCSRNGRRATSGSFFEADREHDAALRQLLDRDLEVDEGLAVRPVARA